MKRKRHNSGRDNSALPKKQTVQLTDRANMSYTDAEGERQQPQMPDRTVIKIV
jgi:hypothetical protein